MKQYLWSMFGLALIEIFEFEFECEGKSVGELQMGKC
jgi:hypothetical protein